MKSVVINIEYEIWVGSLCVGRMKNRKLADFIALLLIGSEPNSIVTVESVWS